MSWESGGEKLSVDINDSSNFRRGRRIDSKEREDKNKKVKKNGRRSRGIVFEETDLHSPVSFSCPWCPSPTSSVAVESAATDKREERSERSERHWRFTAGLEGKGR